MKSVVHVLIMLAIVIASPAIVAAEEPVKVGVSTFAPFVMPTDGGDYRGFAIDLWEQVATEAGITNYEYVLTPASGKTSEFGHKLANVQNGTVDVGIGGITVTAEREGIMDFGYPTFDSGLMVAVKSEVEGDKLITIIIKKFFSKDVLSIIGSLLLIVFGLAFILWLIERKDKHNTIPARFVDREIEKSGLEVAIVIVWEFMTTIGTGRWTPGTRIGYVLTGLTWIVGAAFLGIFVGTVTSAFQVQTAEVIESEIRSPDDLFTKVIATKGGTFSESIAREMGAKKVVGRLTIEEAFDSLKDGSADAVLYDLPGIKYYVATVGNGTILNLGWVLKPHHYAYAYPQGSDLRERINCALLKVRENGDYKRIYDRWFGK